MDVETGLRAKFLSDRQQTPDRTSYATRRLTLIGMLGLWLIGLCVLLDNNSISVKESDILNALVVGDWGRKGLYNQSGVAKQMGIVGAEMNLDFIISVGDNFYEDGLVGVNDSAFTESFSQIYTAESLQKTWHAILGNHDYRGDALAQLDPQLTLKDSRWHCERSFALSRGLTTPEGVESYVNFFFYDTSPFVQKYWDDTEQHYDWRGVEPKEEYLRKQREFLATGLESSNATWKIVLGHHPIRTVGQHGNTVELEDQVLPILQANGVDLYINGHDHCLEHITERGIEFLTSGGGSKASRGMDTSADKSGLQFYYDGQGFLSLSISPAHLSFAFYDVLGNNLHEGHLFKNDGKLQ